MDYRRFGDTVIVRMDPTEEILQQLRLVAEKEHIRLASVEALGAVNDFSVGVFDCGSKRYHSNRFEGAYEIVSLTGTVTTQGGKVYLHLHMSAGDETGRVVGGHLTSATVSATCEMVVRVLDGIVEREFDEDIGLNLLRFT